MNRFKLIEYVYYRMISFYDWNPFEPAYYHSKMYKIHKANRLFALCLFFNILSIAYAIALLFRIKELKLFIDCAFVIAFILAWAISITVSVLYDKKYKTLCKKYKKEKNRSLKGWLIVVYCICSILMFFILVVVQNAFFNDVTISCL